MTCDWTKLWNVCICCHAHSAPFSSQVFTILPFFVLHNLFLLSASSSQRHRCACFCCRWFRASSRRRLHLASEQNAREHLLTFLAIESPFLLSFWWLCAFYKEKWKMCKTIRFRFVRQHTTQHPWKPWRYSFEQNNFLLGFCECALIITTTRSERFGCHYQHTIIKLIIIFLYL